MDTDTSMEENKELRTFDDSTPRELLHEMLFLLRVYCHLRQELPRARYLQPLKPGIDTVRMMKDQTKMGLPAEKWEEPLIEKLLAFDDSLEIKHNCLMMKYGYSERLDMLFYWITEMKTIYFEAGKQR